MASDLIILGFPSKGGAENFLSSLLPLQHEHLIRIEDLAYSVKHSNGKKSRFQFQQTAFEALLRGSLWGTLTGALFLEPFFGMLVGSSTALLLNSSKRRPDSISRRLIRETTEKKLEPGSSALFLMVSKATPDKVLQRVRDHKAIIISTSLSNAEEKRLREAWKTVQSDGPLALHRNEKTIDNVETQLLV